MKTPRVRSAYKRMILSFCFFLILILGTSIAGITYSAFFSQAKSVGQITFITHTVNVETSGNGTVDINDFQVVPNSTLTQEGNSLLYLGKTKVTATPNNGYELSEWQNNPSKVTQDVTITAKFLPITYTITYDLAGGTVSTANPSSYNIETATFTLNNPTRIGYTFLGWTGTDLASASTSVQIAKGSTGNKTFTANWQANELVFDNQTLNNGTYGTAYTSIPFTGASNGTGDYTYTFKGGAPNGATINSDDRTISFPSGTAPGTYNVVVTATDNNSGEIKDVTITITINKANITPTVTMSGYTYGGTKTNPSINENTGNGTVTYYYNTTNSNSGGTAWLTVSNATSLNAGTYYMYATVEATAGYNGATTSAVEFTIAKASGNISFATTTVSKTEGDATFTNALTKTGDGVVTYTSSATSVASVNNSTGEVTIVAIGTTTITATVADGTNYTYATKTATYTLNIIEKPSNLLITGSVLNTEIGSDATSVIFDIYDTKYSDIVQKATTIKKVALNEDETSNGGIKLYKNGTDVYILADSSLSKIIFHASCYNMFYNLQSLTTITFNNIDTSNVTNMDSMFRFCKALTTLNLSSFNTSKVTNMSYIFQGCTALTSLDVSSFNTINVTNMQLMFDSCKVLTSLDVSEFDTSKVTNMRHMFNGCYVLTSLDVSNFTTSNVTNMRDMFSNCLALTSLNVSSFTTSKVTDMGGMFSGCSALTSLSLSGFNTINVTEMDSMFRACSKLTSLNLNSFNTSKVTDMSAMFQDSSSLTSLNLSSFNTSKVTDMSDMFYRCSSLTSLNLSSFNTSNVTDMSGMFGNCSKLTRIYASTNFVTASVTRSTNMFNNCTSLVGGSGTKYNSRKVDALFAKIDGGTSYQGYFTQG